MILEVIRIINEIILLENGLSEVIMRLEVDAQDRVRFPTKVNFFLEIDRKVLPDRGLKTSGRSNPNP